MHLQGDFKKHRIISKYSARRRLFHKLILYKQTKITHIIFLFLKFKRT